MRLRNCNHDGLLHVLCDIRQASMAAPIKKGVIRGQAVPAAVDRCQRSSAGVSRGREVSVRVVGHHWRTVASVAQD